MKTAIILLSFISLISSISSTLFGKLGNPYGTSFSNVRPDIPYNNYGYGYGYQGYSTGYSRPLHVFGNVGSPSSYSYPFNSGYNSGYFGSNNPYYGSNPFTSGYNYNNYQNPYYSKPYTFFPTSTMYKA